MKKNKRMRMKMAAVLITTIVVTLSSNFLSAATLNVFGGQLMGASGVQVGNNSYDVSFQDGSCSGLFDGCNMATEDFMFIGAAAANAASLALINQVFNNNDFDIHPGYTNGVVEPSIVGYIATPYGVVGEGLFAMVELSIAANFYGTLTDDAPDMGFISSVYADSSEWDRGVHAVWNVSPVPLPAAVWLFGTAMAGFGFFMRKTKA